MRDTMLENPESNPCLDSAKPEQSHALSGRRHADNAAQCIFVTGVMRSGTSLLQRVVAQSLATEYIREESSLHVLIESFHVLDQYKAYHLSEFINAPVDLDLEDDTAAYSPDHAFWTPESGTAIASSCLDKYKTELTQEEVDLVLVKLARFNTVFGYMA
jgi:hypothetical protein